MIEKIKDLAVCSFNLKEKSYDEKKIKITRKDTKCFLRKFLNSLIPGTCVGNVKTGQPLEKSNCHR